MSSNGGVPSAWDDDWESLADVRECTGIPRIHPLIVYVESGARRCTASSCSKADQGRKARPAHTTAEGSLGLRRGPIAKPMARGAGRCALEARAESAHDCT